MPRGAAYKVEAPGVCRGHGEAWKEPGKGPGLGSEEAAPGGDGVPSPGKPGDRFPNGCRFGPCALRGPGRPGGALGGGEAGWGRAGGRARGRARGARGREGLTRGAPSVASRRKPRNREGAGGVPPRPQVVTATQGPGTPALGGRRAAGRGPGPGPGGGRAAPRAGPARGRTRARSRPLAGGGAAAAALPGRRTTGLGRRPAEGRRPRARRLPSAGAGPRHGRLAGLGRCQPAEVQREDRAAHAAAGRGDAGLRAAHDRPHPVAGSISEASATAPYPVPRRILTKCEPATQQCVRVPGFCDGENDVHGEGASFPGPLKEENLLNVPNPLPRQPWETREIQSLSGRPRPCDVGGGTALPHNGQNIGLSPFLGTLNTGGSLPDLTNLHYSAPLPASLDAGNHGFGSMGVGNSVGNLPAAMTHLGIRSPSGLQSSRSNPSIQAALNKTALSSSLNSRLPTSAPSHSALHPSLRLFSLSNPSLPTTNLGGPSRRRQPPVSPLTLSPGPEAHPGFSRQLSSTSPLNPYSASQVAPSEQGQPSFPPTEAHARVSPPPPYPTAQELPPPLPRQPPAQEPQAASSLPQPDFQLPAAQGSPLTSFFPDVSFGQQSSPQQVPLVQQGPREPQDPFHLRPNLYSNCGHFPNAILTDSTPSLFKDLSSALAGMPEASLSVDTPFPLEEELQIEPLSLHGLSMLSDSGMGLLDPSVEDTFRADRL
ncbi:CREB-regulated transcription coactivator 3 isoform X2 [Manis pentadactyla]|uniref:CREB-regulated transcription coactivator 3 isoform X2 n=1 Tax=Manis pentadactyla TaxID=143292 RepID=UPI00255C2B3E|nr:CREB-regulated transcription coactivator 3 isoform X2 [Manis pentadactyla]